MKNNKKSVKSGCNCKWIVIGATAVAVVSLALMTVIAFMGRPPKMVNTYEECVLAGGTGMEMLIYPARCNWQGKTYIQSMIEEDVDY